VVTATSVVGLLAAVGSECGEKDKSYVMEEL
jgi:hypothetical protein